MIDPFDEKYSFEIIYDYFIRIENSLEDYKKIINETAVYILDTYFLFSLYLEKRKDTDIEKFISQKIFNESGLKFAIFEEKINARACAVVHFSHILRSG